VHWNMLEALEERPGTRPVLAVCPLRKR
jgi:hypothetical protein